MTKVDATRSVIRPAAVALFTAFYVWYGVWAVLGWAVNAPPKELSYAFLGTLGLWFGERILSKVKTVAP